MKNLQEIKDTYAQEQGYEDWEDLRIEFYGDARPLRIEEFMDEICIRSQKAALEKAADNSWINGSEFSRCGCEIDSTSITNPKNLIR